MVKNIARSQKAALSTSHPLSMCLVVVTYFLTKKLFCHKKCSVKRNVSFQKNVLSQKIFCHKKICCQKTFMLFFHVNLFLSYFGKVKMSQISLSKHFFLLQSLSSHNIVLLLSPPNCNFFCHNIFVTELYFSQKIFCH